MDDKIYTPETIESYPLSQEVVYEESTTSGTSGNTVVKTSVGVDVRFPPRMIARELLSTTLDSQSKRILGDYTFGVLGAISIGEYVSGTSGDIRITPNGITARNVNGTTTFSLDGTTGNASFLGTVSAGSVVVGYAQSFVSTIVWTSTDYNTASWASGTIKVGSTSYSISSGNTGNIAATTYIYLDPDVSTTVLQTTTTATSAVGGAKVPICIVELGTSGSGCIITVVGSYGTTIDADRITTGKIQSADAKTYFDLDGKQIIVNDGSNNRILIGYQSGGF